MWFLKIEGIDPFNLDIATACLIALVCIIIVFGMLALLWGIVSLFKFLPAPALKKEEASAKPKNVQQIRKALKMEDIKDENMMVAALVASIDYHEETKEDVRVTAIREL